MDGDLLQRAKMIDKQSGLVVAEPAVLRIEMR
jgi:hypothetical protein